MPLCFQVLASGSKGNSILVCSPSTRVLLDAGLSGREIGRRLAKSAAGADRLDALLITHEHQDHVRGAGVLSRRFDIPVFLSRGTLEALPPEVGEISHTCPFEPGAAFVIGDLRITPFPISHDAREPVGFRIEHEDTKLGICTDLGIATQLVKTRLQGCHGLIVEANHDPDRLLNGPYPWPLKQRIRSRHGHLSNLDSMDLLKCLHHESLHSVTLAHLSEVNNDPRLVVKCVRELQCLSEWESIRFEIARQHEAAEAVELP